MRHIFHTCLFALRLISSVDSINAQNAALNIFDNSIMNKAFNLVYFSPCYDKNNNSVNLYPVSQNQVTA